MDNPLLIIIAVVVVVLLYQVILAKRNEGTFNKEMIRLQGTISQMEVTHKATINQIEANHKVTIYQIESNHKSSIAALQKQIHDRAQEQFHLWQKNECESIRVQQIEIAKREAVTLLEQWKYEMEYSIRNDAIQRSQSVIMGKVTEHLVPYMPKFKFNPKDVRFIGSPVDLLVFDGLDDGCLNNIVFIEVKTGASSRLTRREQQIRDAIQ